MSDVDSDRTKKWLVRIVKLLVVAIVVWAVHRTFVDAWSQLGSHDWHFRPGWLLAAALLYLIGLAPAGLYWRHVMRTLGQDAWIGESLRAYFIGHLGKYVPGKAMVVVLRAGLIRGPRVDTSVAAVSVFFESFTMIAVGAFLGAAFLASMVRDQIPLLLGAIAIMVVLGLPTLPPIFKRLVLLAKVGKSDPSIREKLDTLGPGTLLLGWLAMTLLWGFLGLSLWATLRSIGVEGLEPIVELPRYTACVALATVVGFLLLIMPGGLGVRELVLVELLVPYLTRIDPAYPDPEASARAALLAVAAAALLRVIWLVSELVISGILYIGGGRTSKIPESTKAATDEMPA